MRQRSKVAAILCLFCLVCTGYPQQTYFGRTGTQFIPGVDFLFGVDLKGFKVPGPNWTDKLLLEALDESGQVISAKAKPLKPGTGLLDLTAQSKRMAWYFPAEETEGKKEALSLQVVLVDEKGVRKIVYKTSIQAKFTKELLEKPVLAGVSRLYVLRAAGLKDEAYAYSKSLAEKFKNVIEVQELYGDAAMAIKKLVEAKDAYTKAVFLAKGQAEHHGPSETLLDKLNEVQRLIAFGG